MGCRANHWYSNEWCKDNHARSQEDLQKIAKQIRENCKVKEICEGSGFGDDAFYYVCTIYENENLGLRYWVKDSFGHISEIDEVREY